MKTKLRSLRIEHFKKIQKLKLDFSNGESYLLLGKNGVGKSSVIQAFNIAMGIENPIDGLVTDGKKDGEIEVIVNKGENEFKIMVYMRQDKDKIDFEVNDGRVKSPKTFIRALTGPIFDMNEMLENQKTAKGRRENEAFFLKLAKLDPERIKLFNDTIITKEAERHETGQKKNALKGYVEEQEPIVQLEVYFQKKDVKPVSEKYAQDLMKVKRNFHEEGAQLSELWKPKFADPIELTKKMGNLKLQEQEWKKYKDAKDRDQVALNELIHQEVDLMEQLKSIQFKLDTTRKNIQDKKMNIIEVEATIKALDCSAEIKINQDSWAKIQEDNAKVQRELDAKLLELHTEITEHNKVEGERLKIQFDKDLQDIENHNIAVEAADDFKKKKQEYEEIQELWNEMQANIVYMRKDRQDYILTGSFPIPGMAYDIESMQVIYNGHKIADEIMSGGQLIKLGSALRIAYNPDGINLVPIPNASLLDEDNLQEIYEEAKKDGICLLYEVVERHQESLRVEVYEPREDAA